jgi:cellulose synthase/poly-beta-1,6-N-acetylglucosamine synthase-like glycosyltransferase
MIATSCALLQLRYQHFEAIVVNDGSKDDTLAVLQRESTPTVSGRTCADHDAARTQHHRSLTHPNLRVIDKENGGGKADATNAGINSARHPIIYAATPIRSPSHSLEHVVRPFLEDPHTVAAAARFASSAARAGGAGKSAFRATRWRWCRWSSTWCSWRWLGWSAMGS